MRKPNKRIFFEVGHGGGRDAGAIAYNGRTELEYNIEVVSGVTKVIKKLMEAEHGENYPNFSDTYGVPEGYTVDFPVSVDKNGLGLQAVINSVNAVSAPEDLLISIHFNYNANTATGTEVFVARHTSDDNKKRASKIVNICANSLGLRVRNSINRFPYKYDNESAVGSLGILRLTKPQAILLEVCFLNEKDLEKYEKNKQVLFNTLGEFLFNELYD